MKKTPNRVTCIYLVACLVVAGNLLAAENATRVSKQKQTQFRQTMEGVSKSRLSAHTYARMWGITVADWRRYRTIMQGPRGTWSPRIDPLTALGIHARNDAERRRFALLQVRLEYQRLQKELAYERAFKAAQKQMFGARRWVDTAAIRRRLAARKKHRQLLASREMLQLGDRLLLFVRLKNCPACTSQAMRAINAITGKTGVGLDIYFVGAHRRDKAAIQAWAKKMPLSVSQVRSGKVTLNYDLGAFNRFNRQKRPVPLVLRKRGTRIGVWTL